MWRALRQRTWTGTWQYAGLPTINIAASSYVASTAGHQPIAASYDPTDLVETVQAAVCQGRGQSVVLIIGGSNWPSLKAYPGQKSGTGT